VINILSNLRFPSSWRCCGTGGTSVYVHNFGELTRNLRASDLIIVNGLETTLKVCELFSIAPWLRKPLVAVDVVLRKPETLRNRVSAKITRHLLRNVDYFLHYFCDLEGYEKYFDVTPERSGYVPFKPNLRHRVELQPKADGEYVLCIGHSMRDYDTFFEAVGRLPYPAAIPNPDSRELSNHRSRFTLAISDLPVNVRMLPDDESQESLVRILCGAKMVVLPILKSNICASGVGIYLNSMLLGKCVVISRGPGASDVLTDQAIFFEPENAEDLATTIRRVWKDDSLRTATAAAGYNYALSLGGEPELCERVLDNTVRWYAEQCSRNALFRSDLTSAIGLRRVG